MTARPIVVIDTSVFLQDAFSKTRTGAASQVLTILPAVAHIVMCDEIRDEIIASFEEHLGWSKAQVLTRYGPVFSAALWARPVEEREDHRRFVNEDADDTVFVRVAEAIYTDLAAIIEAEQVRLIISENTNHLRPGSAYAGFLFGTAHDALAALDVR